MNLRLPLLLLALAIPLDAAQAAPPESLIQLVRVSRTSLNPPMTFLTGLGQLEDFALTRADLTQLASLSTSPPSSAQQERLDLLLGALDSLSKLGDRVELAASEPVRLQDGGGTLLLDRAVRFRVTASEDQVELSQIRGLKGSAPGLPMLAIRAATFFEQGGLPWVTVTLPLGIRFSRPLSPPAPEPGASIVSALKS